MDMTRTLTDVARETDADRRIRATVNQMSDEQLEAFSKMRKFEARMKQEGVDLGDVHARAIRGHRRVSGRAAMGDLVLEPLTTGDFQGDSPMTNDRRTKEQQDRDFASLQHARRTEQMLLGVAGGMEGPMGVDPQTFMASLDQVIPREMEKRAKNLAKEEEKIEKSARVATQEYQQRLKHAVAMMKAEKSLSDELDEQIFIAEKMGGLSSQEISDLKIKKIEADKNLKSSQLFLDTQVEIAALSKKLDISATDEAAIMKQIAEARADGVIDDKERLSINDAIKAANRDISGELDHQTTEKLNQLLSEDAL